MSPKGTKSNTDSAFFSAESSRFLVFDSNNPERVHWELRPDTKLRKNNPGAGHYRYSAMMLHIRTINTASKEISRYK